METYEQIKELFEANGDAQRAAAMAAYMPDQFLFYGIPTPQRRALIRPLLRAEKQAGRIDWALLDLCYSDPHREMQYVVCDYLRSLQALLTYDDLDRIKVYAQTKSWWDTIDSLDQTIGAIGLRDHRVDERMLAWAQDADFWLRRIAIDHQLGRKERTNTALLEQILVWNLGSEEFFINKAIGWSLREYSKQDPAWVRAFIDAHREAMSARSIREASRYL